MALSARQERFAREYVIDLDGPAAYRRAGYTAKNSKTASACAARTLAIDSVQALIAELQTKAAAKLGLSQERVLRELAALAFSDLRKAFHADGRLKGVHELDDETAAALASIETEERLEGSGDAIKPYTVRKIKVWDKKGSLELAMRHMGMLNDRLSLSGGLRVERVEVELVRP